MLSDDGTELIPLPDSRLNVVATPKGSVWRGQAWWHKIFCVNCGADGGLVPEENMTGVFYLCDPCAEKYGDIEGCYMMPDRIFFERVRQEQEAKYGRVLTAQETMIKLSDPESLESKLARDRLVLTPKPGV